MKSDPVRLAIGLVVLALVGWVTISILLPLAFAVVGLLAYPLLLVLVGAGVVYGWRRLRG